MIDGFPSDSGERAARRVVMRAFLVHWLLCAFALPAVVKNSWFAYGDALRRYDCQNRNRGPIRPTFS